MLEAATVSPVTTFGFVAGVGLLVDDSKCMLTKFLLIICKKLLGFAVYLDPVKVVVQTTQFSL